MCYLVICEYCCVPFSSSMYLQRKKAKVGKYSGLRIRAEPSLKV